MNTKTYGQILRAGIAVTLLGYLLYHPIQSRFHAKETLSANTTAPATGLGCGQAALMTVAQAHSEKTTMKLRSLLMESECVEKTVTSLYDLANWARAAGLKPVGLKIDSANLADLPLPAIVHTKHNHFLALMAVDEERAVVVDGGVSQYEIRPRDFDELFSGYVLCFQ